jgi:hypothetical protein
MRQVEDPDQRVILGGIDWWQFEAFLAIRVFAATPMSRSRRAS